jgi:integrase
MKFTSNGLMSYNPTSEEAVAHPTVAGLSLRFRPTKGRVTKTWIWARMIGGKRSKETLGTFPLISIDDAKVWAENLNRHAENGQVPREAALEAAEREREAAAAAQAIADEAAAVQAARETIGTAFESYLTACARRGVKTIAGKRGIMEKDFLPWHRDQYLPVLRKADVRAAIERCLTRRQKSPEDVANFRMANRVRTEVVSFLTWCVRHDIDDLQVNVAASIEKFKEPRVKPRRHLTVDELALMVVAARNVENQDTADAYLLLALTGCRLMEVFAARSSEFSDVGWNIPGPRVKNGLDHLLPLGPIGRGIFERRHNSDYLFPAHRRGDKPHRSSSFRKTLDRMTLEMERIAGHPITRWTTHSTRHGFRTYIRKMKFADKELAERLINHCQPNDIDEMYDHDDFYDEKQAALAGWEAMLMDRIARLSGENVVQIAA